VEITARVACHTGRLSIPPAPHRIRSHCCRSSAMPRNASTRTHSGRRIHAASFMLHLPLDRAPDPGTEVSVCERGVANCSVPMVDRKLAGHNRQSCAMLIVEHFEQVPPAHVVEDCQPSIVECQDVDLGELFEQFVVSPITPRLQGTAARQYAVATRTIFPVHLLSPFQLAVTAENTCASQFFRALCNQLIMQVRN
jgi:hypothetical protein